MIWTRESCQEVLESCGNSEITCTFRHIHEHSVQHGKSHVEYIQMLMRVPLGHWNRHDQTRLNHVSYTALHYTALLCTVFYHSHMRWMGCPTHIVHGRLPIHSICGPPIFSGREFPDAAHGDTGLPHMACMNVSQ